jgi:dTDP-4-amino-4,6-dideoxygalactose transaminase
MSIPFLSLKSLNSKIESELKSVFNTFLDNGYYILGNNVKSFEFNFAKYCESNHCIGLANGLDALILIIESYDFKRGSEIIVPANTYFASILAILKAGMKPVLIEPNQYDFLINPKNVEEAITPKTVAILAVNLYGKMCNFNALDLICSNYKLKLFVDAAQSHGAIFEGSTKCKNTDATAYSFYPTKNLGAMADAGAVITDNEDINEKITSLRNYGSSEKYIFDYQGINSRLSELQAGILDVKLKYLDQEINFRRTLAHNYLIKIKNDIINLPPNDNVYNDAWHLFVVRTEQRQKFTNYLTKNGVGYDIHYPIPPHKQKALIEFSTQKLPITEQIHQQVVSLPLNSSLTPAQQDQIIDTVNQFKI